MKILSAVTTCQKRQQYLPDTLDSLYIAGFDPVVIHDENNAGSYCNFKSALRTLVTLSEFPHAKHDALCVFQDDIAIARGIREHLESWLWPEAIPESIGVVSLYTASINHREQSGWYTKDELPNDDPFGALAYIFPACMAARFLADNYLPECLTGTDTAVGNWCRERGLSYWMHSPSFVKHTGIKSAIHDSYELVANTPFGLLNRQCREWIQDVAELRTHAP